MIQFQRFKKLRVFQKSFRSLSTEVPVLLEFEREANVARIVLNEPKVHNALSEETIGLLHEKLDEVTNSKCRCLILSSNGKNFSAGANLNYMKRQGSFTKAENITDALNLSDLFNKLYQMRVPTIASVTGASFGGALGLISACDIAICTKESKFCFSEVKLGLIPATIGPFVVNRIGKSNAKKLFLTAELFNASTAQRIGLIHDIAETSEAVRTRETEIIDLILSNGPNAVTQVKELISLLDTYDLTAIETRTKTAEMLADIRSSEEAKEGLTAFFEKRKPSYNKT